MDRDSSNAPPEDPDSPPQKALRPVGLKARTPRAAFRDLRCPKRLFLSSSAPQPGFARRIRKGLCKLLGQQNREAPTTSGTRAGAVRSQRKKPPPSPPFNPCTGVQGC